MCIPVQNTHSELALVSSAVHPYNQLLNKMQQKYCELLLHLQICMEWCFCTDITSPSIIIFITFFFKFQNKSAMIKSADWLENNSQYPHLVFQCYQLTRRTQSRVQRLLSCLLALPQCLGREPLLEIWVEQRLSWPACSAALPALCPSQ